MSADLTPFDPLTGALNRGAFEKEYEDAIKRAQETGSPFSLALVDIDLFMNINKEFGREAGDVVLKDVVKIVQQAVGDGVIVSRYGGDEFVLIFPNIERERAFLTLERARAEVEQIKKIANISRKLEKPLTITCGVAAFPIDAQDKNELFRKADQALYKGKASGRNKIVIAYDEKMSPKTSHYTLTQLERLSQLAKEQGVGEAVLLREALDDLLIKYNHSLVR